MKLTSTVDNSNKKNRPFIQLISHKIYRSKSRLVLPHQVIPNKNLNQIRSTSPNLFILIIQQSHTNLQNPLFSRLPTYFFTIKTKWVQSEQGIPDSSRASIPQNSRQNPHTPIKPLHLFFPFSALSQQTQIFNSPIEPGIGNSQQNRQCPHCIARLWLSGNENMA